MEPDDRHRFDEEPARFLEVPRQALRPRGAPGRWAAAAWLSAIALVIGVAAQPRAGGTTLDEAARPPAPKVAVGVSVTVAPSAPVAADEAAFGEGSARPVLIVDLVSPGPGTVRVTSNELTVAGSVLVRAARVEIVLAANGNRLFGEASADVSDRDGGIRPAYPPGFEVRFDLATPRPMGTMLVVVTAYDAAGSPIGGIRRAISIETLSGG